MGADNLGKALYVYAHFRRKSGDILNSNYFLGVGRLRSWRAVDLQDGIEQARSRGFVEASEDGWRLTDLGFQQIESVAAQ